MRLAGTDTAKSSLGGSVAAGIAASAVAGGGETADVHSEAEPEVACGEAGGQSLVLWVGLKFRAIARSHLEFYAMLNAPKNAEDRPVAAAAKHSHAQAAGGALR
jgi:hypothetical protein